MMKLRTLTSILTPPLILCTSGANGDQGEEGLRCKDDVEEEPIRVAAMARRDIGAFGGSHPSHTIKLHFELSKLFQ